MTRPPLAIVGPTASGKSALAFAIARRLAPEIELVSVDSMQVYRGMDIGTAKSSAADRAEIRHHMVDVADPEEEFSVARFQRGVAEAMAGIVARGRTAVLVGGTGLYLRAVVDGLRVPGQWPEVKLEVDAEPDTLLLHQKLTALDPIAAARMEPTNRRRIVRALEVTLGSGQPFSSFGPGLDAYPTTPFVLIGLHVGREELTERIRSRFAAMLRAGLVDEVRGLLTRPGGLSRTARQALGYREVLAHLEDGRSLHECIEEAILRTRQFARRQEAWFRRDPRIVWYDAPDGRGQDNPLAVADRVLGDWEDRCALSS